MRHSPVAALATTLLLIGAMSAEGQRLEIALPLDLAPPGARSAGMGRAFVGLADDATAAAANPAGLVNLLRPEISYHFRIDEVDAVKRDFGGQGLLTSTASNIVPAYFSLVMPVAGGRVAWSAYYQQTVRGTFSFREDFATGARNSFVYGSQDDSSLTIGQVGGSVAFSAVGSLLAFGASVARSYASLDSRSRSFSLVENALGRSQSLFDDRVDDVEQAWTYNIGLRTQPTNHIAVGAVYRSGASFELDLMEEWVFSGNSGDSQSYTLHGPFRFAVPIQVPPFVRSWCLDQAGRWPRDNQYRCDEIPLLETRARLRAVRRGATNLGRH